MKRSGSRAIIICFFLGVAIFLPFNQVFSDEVKKVQVNSLPTGVNIEWTKDNNSQRSILVRSESGFPQNVKDGKVLYDGSGNNYLDTDIKLGKKYYYSVISVSQVSITQTVTKRIIEVVEKVPQAAQVGVAVVGAGSQIITMVTLVDSFKDLGLSLTRIFQIVLAALFLKKRNQWGVVYDWVNKTPLKNIPLSVVNLRGERLEGTISDAAGRFGFLAGKGEYQVKVAGSQQYTFDPRQYQNYDIYGKVYKGKPIKIEKEGDTTLKLNVPLVSKSQENANNIERITRLVRLPKFLNLILEFLFWLGFVFMGFSLSHGGTVLSFGIFIIYIVVILVRFIGYLNTRDLGLIVDVVKKTPIPFVVVRAVKRINGESEQLGVAVTNTNGNFYLLRPKEADTVVIKGRTIEGRNFQLIKPIIPGIDIIKGTYFV